MGGWTCDSPLRRRVSGDAFIGEGRGENQFLNKTLGNYLDFNSGIAQKSEQPGSAARFARTRRRLRIGNRIGAPSGDIQFSVCVAL